MRATAGVIEDDECEEREWIRREGNTSSCTHKHCQQKASVNSAATKKEKSAGLGRVVRDAGAYLSWAAGSTASGTSCSTGPAAQAGATDHLQRFDQPAQLHQQLEMTTV